MAKVLVTSDDGVIVVRIEEDDDEGHRIGKCSECEFESTEGARYSLDDMIEEAEHHVDMHYGGGGSGE